MWKRFISRTDQRLARRPASGLATALAWWLLLLAHGCAIHGAGTATAPEAAPGLPAGGAAGKPLPPAPEVESTTAETFARATGLLLDGELGRAEALLLEVTAEHPELAGPWVNLARIYLMEGREDEALAALGQAVTANPANCAARTELGVLLRRRGDFAGAEAHYLACLEYRPGYQAAHLNLGILYELYLGRLDEALEAYRRYQSLAAEPDDKVRLWVVDLERRVGS